MARGGRGSPGASDCSLQASRCHASGRRGGGRQLYARSMSNPQDIQRKRLRIRAWRRGFKEADLILGRFADAQPLSVVYDSLVIFLGSGQVPLCSRSGLFYCLVPLLLGAVPIDSLAFGISIRREGYGFCGLGCPNCVRHCIESENKKGSQAGGVLRMSPAGETLFAVAAVHSAR